MKKTGEYKICRNDILLAAALAAAATLLFMIFLFAGKDKDAHTVVITLNGNEYGTYSLFEDKEIEINGDPGHNKIIIKNGEVFMADADCPDKYCISKGAISRSGETIVCLPHRLVVEIRSEEADQEIDAVAQ